MLLESGPWWKWIVPLRRLHATHVLIEFFLASPSFQNHGKCFMCSQPSIIAQKLHKYHENYTYKNTMYIYTHILSNTRGPMNFFVNSIPGWPCYAIQVDLTGRIFRWLSGVAVIRKNQRHETGVTVSQNNVYVYIYIYKFMYTDISIYILYNIYIYINIIYSPKELTYPYHIHNPYISIHIHTYPCISPEKILVGSSKTFSCSCFWSFFR